MLADYHIHVAAHGEHIYSAEWIERFLDTAVKKGISEIGFSEHQEYAEMVDWAIVERVGSKRKNIKIRCGLEADYIPGQESRARNYTMGCRYDYIIGSVHFIEGWGFDHPDFRGGFDAYDIDEIYRKYFNLVGRMAQSGLFDIVGHMDLIKIWGHRPRSSINTFIDPVLQAIRQAGIAVELNSAGLRKPVCEMYPAQDILREMYNLNIPVTLGSDAHHPDQVGEDFDSLVQTATSVGYKAIMTFEGRKARKVIIK